MTREAPPRRVVSSKNFPWFMLLIPSLNLILGMWWEILAASRLWLRASPTNIYKKGKRGHPCQRPLEAWKNPSPLPLIRVEIQDLAMHFSIHPMKVSLNPIFIMSRRNLCRTLSNALAISNLMTIPCSSRLQLESMASWIKIVLCHRFVFPRRSCLD